MTVLTCEECQTQFSVSAEKIGTGRKVRCTNCGHIWFQKPEKDAAEDVAEDVFEVEEPDDFKEALAQAEDAEPVPESIKPESSEGSKALLTEDEETRQNASVAGGVIFISLLLLTIIFMLAAQNTVLKIWPQSAALYSAIGLAPEYPWQGLRFSDGRAMIRQTGEGEDMLYVEAEVTNITDAPKTIPAITVALTDPDSGEMIQSWQPAAEAVELPPGKAHIIKLGFIDVAQKRGRVKIFFSQKE
ncbi:MAG: zinc-ribbon domain-containing protein [Pseudomonadota bacterium]